MPDLRVRRTLVKSPPELWAEVSEVEALARHLGEFGEITITRAEPETTVAWEGDGASGTVELEPTGWGTKVTMTAQVPEPPQPEVPPEAIEPDPFDPDPDPFDPEPEAIDPEPVLLAAEPEPEREREPEPRRRGVFGRWLFRERRGAPEPAAEAPLVQPEPVQPEPEPEPEPEPVDVSPEPFEAAEDDFEFDFAVPRESMEEQAAPEEEPPAPIEPERAREVLEATLENLGQAHHRPFSRG